MNKSNTRRGFTLIELLVVVLIISILAAVAVPQYQKVAEKSRSAQALTMVKALAHAQQVYFLSHGNYATQFRELDVDVPFTGNSSWLSGSSDTRSNEDWTFQLFNNFETRVVSAGRLAGAYRGTGFNFYLISDLPGVEAGQIYCIERISDSSGVIFKKTKGDFCEKLFAGVQVFENSFLRIFKLK